MKKVFRPNFNHLENQFDSILNKFKKEGELIGSEKRNVIKFFDLEDGTKVNVKSFKKPNTLNTIIYGYIRKSKAQRSFEYATLLLEKGIGTPQPYAYYENKSVLGLEQSYYFSNQQDIDLMFRNLVFDSNYPNREEIIKQTAQFFFKVHNEGIEFIDNTAGNTLIKKVGENEYKFYLVDLNRMSFHANLSMEQRARNIAKLTTEEDINSILAKEYAKLYQVNENEFFQLLMKEANGFLERFNRRKKIKKTIKFWKK